MRFAVVSSCIVMLVASPAWGQPPPSWWTPDHLQELPPVSLEDRADAIVVIIPNKRENLHLPEGSDREIQGTLTRLDKLKQGKRPQTIVHQARTLVRPLEAGVPVKLFLVEDPKREGVYLIIGVHSIRKGED